LTRLCILRSNTASAILEEPTAVPSAKPCSTDGKTGRRTQ
jgi:hypothetical protein